MRLPIKGEYAIDWPTISAETKIAAGHRCVRCHHPFTPDGRPLPCDERCDRVRGRTVAVMLVGYAPHDTSAGLNYGVHHFDGDKSNNRWWNRMALCNSCHLTIQARVIPERPWLLPHSEWARPYVAGFYAWWFAETEITRAQAEEQTALWLAVGQPWLAAEMAPLAHAAIAIGLEAAATRRLLERAGPARQDGCSEREPGA